MEKLSEMSTAEIKLYQESLANKYEVLKNKINEELKELDSMDKEYISAEKELNKRKNKTIV